MLKTVGNLGLMNCGRVSMKGITISRIDSRPLSFKSTHGLTLNSRSQSSRRKTTSRSSSYRRYRPRQFIRCEVSASPISQPSAEESSTSRESSPRFSPAAAKQLSKATRALRSFGWIGFWSQLALGLSSGVVLLFSIAFTAQSAPKVALYLTALGVSATFIACFQYFAMVRTSRRMKDYLEAPPGATVRKISKEMVVNSISQSLATAIVGLGCTVIAMQYSVGLLLAKTLTNASANPFVVGSQGVWNPVLAFDVFLLQATTNTTLSHTIGSMICLWLLIKLRDRSLWEALFGSQKTAN
eukprot:g6087.t1